MPHRITTPSVPVDSEWATSSRGLRLKIPDNWWNGCSGNQLNAGTIKSIKLNDNAGRHFVVELDDDKQRNQTLRRPVVYQLRYNAVLLYADKTDNEFPRFHLPARQPSPPQDEQVRVHRDRQSKGAQRRADVTRAYNENPARKDGTQDVINSRRGRGGSRGEYFYDSL